MTVRVAAALAAVALALAVTACDAGKVLNDDAACPGETCTDDTRDRLEAIAALDGVTEVETVARSYSFDRGSAREARLRASVETRTEARGLLLEVLRELEDWPEHDTGPANATVTSDPEVVVDYRRREELALPPGQFEPCAGATCAAALDEVAAGVAEEYDDVELALRVRDGVLWARAATTPAQFNLVAAAIERHLFVVGLRVAERAVIDVRAEGPLQMTLSLDDGLVCEEPIGVTITCDAEDPDAVPFEDAELSRNS